jgi:hypothetical protein
MILGGGGVEKAACHAHLAPHTSPISHPVQEKKRMVDSASLRAKMMMGGVPFLPVPLSSFKNSGNDKEKEEEEEEEGVVSRMSTAAPSSCPSRAFVFLRKHLEGH